MFDYFFKDIKYEEYNGLTASNQPSYKSAVNIKGLRLKGQIKVTTSDDGDSTTCSICYKTQVEVKPLSKIEGRTVVDCTPVNALWVDEDKAGYLVYVK